jgi:DNA-binding IclR family transcriptional regulator
MVGVANQPHGGNGSASGSWTFLSNHTHVLVCLARDPEARLRDIAARVGITERGVFRVIRELERGGVIKHTRQGRRNHYTINTSPPLRHELESARSVGSLLELLLEPAEAERLALADVKLLTEARSERS